MNTKSNQRYQQTEKKILEAFYALLLELPLQRITVQMICQRAGINRSTFYAHHQDVYALMEPLEASMAQNLLSIFAEKHVRDIGEAFTAMFRLIQQNIPFCRAYWAYADGSKIWDLVLEARLSDRQRHRFFQEMGYASEREYRYHQQFFKAGLTRMIRVWLEDGCPESPEEMAQILHREYHPRESLFQWN